MNVDNEHELFLFEKAVRLYNFNCVEAVEEDDGPEKKKLKQGQSLQSLPSTSTQEKQEVIDGVESQKQQQVMDVLELFDDELESQDFI